MADFAVTSEEVLRRLIAMERAYAGRPTNERVRRRRHHAPRVRASLIKLAKLDGDCAAGGSATASIWTADAGTETDSGDNVTVYDWMIVTGKEIVSGSKIVIANADGFWYIISTGTCPTTV